MSEAIDGKASMGKVYALLKRQGFACALSGRELTPASMRADHIVAVSKGGSRFMENIQLVTDQVNAAKGTMSNEEFIEMCCDVADVARGLRVVTPYASHSRQGKEAS